MTPQFTHPWALLLLALLPPLAWWLARQPRAVLRHPDTRLLEGLPVPRAHLVRWGRALLRALALACVAVALAGPRWPDLHTRLPADGISIVLLVDVSSSMSERDFDSGDESVTRLGAAQRVFRLFVRGGDADGVALEGRPTDRIGMVTFGTRPETVCPLTLSHSAVVALLDREKPRDSADERETNLVDAVATGLQLLRAGGSKRKVLVLLTDGEHNAVTRSGWTTRQAAQIAASLDVPIYTIDAAGSTGSADPGQNEVRERAVQTLREMADLSRGRSFQARDTAGLLQACQAIDRLEREGVASNQLRRYHEGYPWAALAGFALLAAALALDATLWRTLP